jgi:hypothetical protein
MTLANAAAQAVEDGFAELVKAEFQSTYSNVAIGQQDVALAERKFREGMRILKEHHRRCAAAVIEEMTT